MQTQAKNALQNENIKDKRASTREKINTVQTVLLNSKLELDILRMYKGMNLRIVRGN